MYAKGIDGYKAERLPGSFQEVPKGAPLKGCFTIDEFGRRWQVQ
ncbi:S-adenosyl-L-methionine hydrolase [Pantoea phage vB_PdeP_F5M1C]|nr:S-adenosyl-L-methionine hydrolase [Pantoea phage vB_PdeP_F5M1C]